MGTPRRERARTQTAASGIEIPESEKRRRKNSATSREKEREGGDNKEILQKKSKGKTSSASVHFEEKMHVQRGRRI